MTETVVGFLGFMVVVLWLSNYYHRKQLEILKKVVTDLVDSTNIRWDAQIQINKSSGKIMDCHSKQLENIHDALKSKYLMN